MKKFIIYTLWFILPFVIIAIPMEYMLRQIPNNYKYKKKYLDKHSNEIQTLILGSSHTFYGIDPIYFSTNTFNASHVSQSLYFDFEIFKMYQNEFANLETVVLPISCFTLWTKLQIGIESWRVKDYVIYYGMNANSISNYSEILSHKLISNITRIEDCYIKGNQNISCTELGWGTTHKSQQSVDLQITGKTAALRHKKDVFSETSIDIFNENIAILNKFALFCAEHNIQLILISTPAYITYRENLDKQQLAKMVETAANFAEEHTNCEYINLLDDSDFTAQDFYDADHLNGIGAKKLSLKVANDIKEQNLYKN